MIVLGIDPAHCTGLALVRRRATRGGGPVYVDLLSSCTVTGATGAAARSALQHIFGSRGLDPELVTAVIEEQYVGANPRSALTVARCAGLWRGAVESVGVSRVESVLAQRWQSAMLSGLVSARAPRIDRKRAAARMAFLRWSVSLTYDEADAALLAAWACERGEVE